MWVPRTAYGSPPRRLSSLSPSDRSGRYGIRLQKVQMTPEEPAGLWVRLLVRAFVVVTAGVMALGFFGPGEALLVVALASLTFVLLWLRTFVSSRLAERKGEERPEDGA